MVKKGERRVGGGAGKQIKNETESQEQTTFILSRPPLPPALPTGLLPCLAVRQAEQFPINTWVLFLRL